MATKVCHVFFSDLSSGIYHQILNIDKFIQQNYFFPTQIHLGRLCINRIKKDLIRKVNTVYSKLAYFNNSNEWFN